MRKSFSKPKRLLACFVSAALTLNLLTTTALSENVYEESESTVYGEPQTDAVLDETSVPETMAETLSALETQTTETDLPETETSVEPSSETETQAETMMPESEPSSTVETALEENAAESETAAPESFSETEMPTEEPSSESASPEETEMPESEALLTEEVLPEEVSTETELLEDLNLPASLEDHADAAVEPLVQNLENAASYTVSFDSKGGSAVDSQTVTSGETAVKPTDPTMDVYTFIGWYSDEALTSAYDFNTPVTGNITLYAKWEIPINGTTFPDETFRNLVSADFDKNSDGFLSAAEIGAVTDIRCRWRCIASLKGIEYFTSLQTLDCYSNQLTSLDLSANTALTTLNCGNNWLSFLNVSSNTALTNLDCYNNELTSLELSANTALTSLDCSKNQLTSLDLSANMALTALDCRNNQLASLDLSSNTSLTSLNCNGNQLASLELSANTALTTLYCNNNQLDSLDVSKNAALISLNCRGNQLTSLDLSQNTALEWLYCDNNHLTSLDIRAASIVTWYGSPQSYTITVNFDRQFDLSSLPGSFDVSKASGWDGGTVNGTTLTVDDDAAQVTYSYDVGNSKTMDVTLNANFNYCTVTFDSNGGSSVDSQSVIKGGHATEPEPPLKTCSAFVGWYTDSGLVDAFDFDNAILTDMTLYAKWTDSHTPGAAVKEKETAPSCTEDGSYENVVFCTVCSTELSRDTVIVPATGHNWNNGVVTLEPTTEAEGIRTYTCAACGNTRTETIAKLPPETEAPTEPAETETETKTPETEEPKETETETKAPETEEPAETETPVTEEPTETETETKAPETEKPKETETETSSIGEPPETEPETHETETEAVTPETEKPAETESETETKAPATSGTSQTPTPPDASPKTGDETRLDLWFALMAVSLAGFAGILFTGKRRKKDR